MTLFLLPNAEQQFFDDNGVPLALGTVTFYIPSTTTPKDTWADANGNVLNANPLTLDAAGRAVIWGSGAYRQIVKDSLGNTIWDQETSVSTVSGDTSPTRSASTNTSLTADDGSLFVDASSGAISVTLPLASSVTNQKFVVKKVDSTSNIVTLVGSIDGQTNPVLNYPNQDLEFQSNGSVFYAI